MDKQTVSNRDGWTRPDNFRLQREFFAKYGEDHYTREIDRRWRIMGKLIDAGSRIDDGRLAR